MFDWGWEVSVSAWQTLATVGFIITGLFVGTKLLVRFWPGLKKLIRGVDAVIQLPDFMEKVAKDAADQKATMAEQSQQLADISHEVNYNNGSSVKDAVARVELGIKGIYHRLDGVEESVEALHDTDEDLQNQIESTQPRSRFEPKEKP